MKILHTADWHIGQNFFEFDRKEEHQVFFAWLKEQIKQLAIDVLLVAGDVFDSPNPSAVSQKMYYNFLKEVTTENKDLQIIIIAGNHDSAARLEAPNPLLEDMNVTVKGIVKRTPEGEIDYKDLLVPILRDDKQTVAWCMAVPYLRQGDYPNAKTYGEGISLFYENLYNELTKERKPDEAILAMGHLQATGSEVSANDRSERTIVGGLEAVSPSAFDRDGIIYTALGHLHKAQRVSKREHVRYAGSPLPMSFAEKYYKQGATLIEVEKSELRNIERIEFDSPVKLLSLPSEQKTLDGVLEELQNLPDGEVTNLSPYLEVKVLITEPEPSMRHQIEEVLEGKAVRLARIEAIAHRQKREAKPITYEELKTINPLEMAEDVFKNKYSNDMPDAMKEMLQTIIREVEK